MGSVYELQVAYYDFIIDINVTIGRLPGVSHADRLYKKQPFWTGRAALLISIGSSLLAASLSNATKVRNMRTNLIYLLTFRSARLNSFKQDLL